MPPTTTPLEMTLITRTSSHRCHVIDHPLGQHLDLSVVNSWLRALDLAFKVVIAHLFAHAHVAPYCWHFSTGALLNTALVISTKCCVHVYFLSMSTRCSQGFRSSRALRGFATTAYTVRRNEGVVACFVCLAAQHQVPARDSTPEQTLFVAGLNEGKFFGQAMGRQICKLQRAHGFPAGQR